MKKTTGAPANATQQSLKAIVASFGALSRSCHDVRHCSRCGDSLTDPASWERGIGPVCAKKDTHLFAKTIPVNATMVIGNIIAVRVEQLPEQLRPLWTELQRVIFEKTSSMVATANGLSFVVAGEDLRLVAKIIDWMLSFRGVPPQEKRLMIGAVRALGFPGLAAVLSGKASTGESSIKFDSATGLITMTGSMNKHGYLEMRRVPGVTLPRFRGRSSYTATAQAAHKFLETVMEFWPCFDENIETIREQADSWVAAHQNTAAVSAPVSPRLPKAALTKNLTDKSLGFTFQWVAGTSPQLIQRIKENIPAAHRTYDPKTYTWTVFWRSSGAVEPLLKAAGYEIEWKVDRLATFPKK